MSLFSFFYYILATVVYILALPYLLIKKKNPKYKDAIPAKFFLANNPKFEKEGIWFHTCSMGETKAIKPLVEAVSDDVNISVITNTGFDEAKNLDADVRFLPYEIFLPFWIRKQKALVVMEAELWYMLFLIASKRDTKTFLINARISDKSYNSYKKFAFFYKKVFANVDKIFAQTQEDKKRLEELGAKNIEVIGNIKLAQLPKVTQKLEKPEGILITAGSTHENEEELILNAYEKSQGKLVIVPRHPERFDKVEKLIEAYASKKDFTFHRYSKQEDFNSDVILIDKMGVLVNIFAISDLVILGGAFEKIGGHNPVEPAFFNCKLISGKQIFNQKSLFECVKNYYIIENEELKDYLDKIDELEEATLVQEGDIKPIIKELNELR